MSPFAPTWLEEEFERARPSIFGAIAFALPAPLRRVASRSSSFASGYVLAPLESASKHSTSPARSRRVVEFWTGREPLCRPSKVTVPLRLRSGVVGSRGQPLRRQWLEQQESRRRDFDEARDCNRGWPRTKKRQLWGGEKARQYHLRRIVARRERQQAEEERRSRLPRWQGREARWQQQGQQREHETQLAPTTAPTAAPSPTPTPTATTGPPTAARAPALLRPSGGGPPPEVGASSQISSSSRNPLTKEPTNEQTIE